MRPAGRAMLRGCEYTPAHEQPSAEYPLLFTTGRTVFQFHTRTKTGRSRRLQDAAPEPWAEISPDDAVRYRLREGDLVQIESPRGSMQAPVRIGLIAAGTVFVPFHYGSFDVDVSQPAGRTGQANELTMTIWDPVSKQPYFKTAACRITKIVPAPPQEPAPGPARGGGQDVHSPGDTKDTHR